MSDVYPPEDQLYELIEDGASIPMLSNWYGVDREVIFLWLGHYELEALSRSERQQARKQMEGEGRAYPFSIPGWSNEYYESLTEKELDLLKSNGLDRTVVDEKRQEVKKRDEQKPGPRKYSRNKLLDFVRAGVTIQQLAKSRNRSEQTVRSWFVEEDIDISSIDKDPPKKRREPSTFIPPRKQLKKLFIDRNLTLVEIAKIYNVNHNKVNKWTMHYGLTKARKIDPDKIPSKADLHHDYAVMRMKATALSKKWDISSATLYRYLEKYEIPLRGKPKMPIPPKKTLEHFYKVEGKTARQIGDYYQAEETTVRHWLRHHKIRRGGKFVTMEMPERDELYRLYIKQNMTAVEIAEWLDTDEDRVRRWLVKSNIRKTLVPLPKPSRELLQRLYLEENKSQPEIAEMFLFGMSKLCILIREYGLLKKPRKELKHAG